MSPLASAALARFDHHVGQLLDAWRAAYEVHDGEGLQVLGDAAGRGGGLGVHLVVQGQDLSVHREETPISQHATCCEESAVSLALRWSLKASHWRPGQVHLYTAKCARFKCLLQLKR